jgi:hypothetical protein
MPFWIVRRQMHQHANSPHALALLRARRERPHRHRAAKCGQQFPASYGDWHAPLSVRGCLENTIPRRVHAVSTFKEEGWLLLGGL